MATSSPRTPGFPGRKVLQLPQTVLECYSAIAQGEGAVVHVPHPALESRRAEVLELITAVKDAETFAFDAWQKYSSSPEQVDVAAHGELVKKQSAYQQRQPSVKAPKSLMDALQQVISTDRLDQLVSSGMQGASDEVRLVMSEFRDIFLKLDEQFVQLELSQNASFNVSTAAVDSIMAENAALQKALSFVKGFAVQSDNLLSARKERPLSNSSVIDQMVTETCAEFRVPVAKGASGYIVGGLILDVYLDTDQQLMVRRAGVEMTLEAYLRIHISD
eukprot:GEMP01072744.1.p1 GENE.GEMP01072744.1~~GEMP01072744.1.p1  ORF type:complete len:275 (-),score=59.73 GEMP01072744.1:229-1053(-)